MLALGQRNSVNLFTGPVRTITLIEAATGRIRRTFAGHESGPNCLAFSGDGARLVSGGRKGDLKVWDVKREKPICSVRDGDGEIVAVALSPDGKTLASAHEPAEVALVHEGPAYSQEIPVTIRVWDADTGTELMTLTGHPGGVYRLTYRPDGKVLASAGSGMAKLWDLATGTELREIKPAVQQAMTSDLLLFSPNGDRLITTSGFRILQLWDVATGVPWQRFKDIAPFYRQWSGGQS